MSEELRSIPPQHGSFVFTSESVTEGHPDKIADQISDAVLDAILAKEIELQEQGYIAPNGVPANVENVRCACETLVTTGTVIVAGEIRTQAYVDVQEIARGVIRRIGYNRAKFGFDCDTCGVMSLIHEQSPDIAQGVDESFETQTGATTDPIDLIGAGDQGMMFGYASNETKTLMPMPHYLASRLAERLAAVRHDGTLLYLRPDGKTQVTVRYEDGKPVEVTTIVISTQHAAEIEDMGKIKDDLIEHVIAPVMAAENMPWDNADIYVNPTGRFVVGGPMGDTGLTGRKIIVDTYGGYGRHGGGAFSGKDCTAAKSSLPTPSAFPSPSQSWSTPSVPRMLPRTRSSRPSRRPSTCARARSSATWTCADRSTRRRQPTATSAEKTPTLLGRRPIESKNSKQPAACKLTRKATAK